MATKKAPSQSTKGKDVASRARAADRGEKAKGSLSVDAYLAGIDPKARPILEKVRAVVSKALPGAEEVISYQIPAYKLADAAVLYFAAWKDHFALYPVGDLIPQRLAKELQGHIVSKGTIRFPYDAPIPAKLIRQIALLRREETLALVAARALKKAAAKRPAHPTAAPKTVAGAKKTAKTKPAAGPKPAVRTKAAASSKKSAR